jgi:hypothetical protein
VERQGQTYNEPLSSQIPDCLVRRCRHSSGCASSIGVSVPRYVLFVDVGRPEFAKLPPPPSCRSDPLRCNFSLIDLDNNRARETQLSSVKDTSGPTEAAHNLKC